MNKRYTHLEIKILEQIEKKFPKNANIPKIISNFAAQSTRLSTKVEYNKIR